MKNLVQHSELPLWFQVVKKVLASYLEHKRVEITVVVPHKADWLQEFGDTNGISVRAENCGGGLIAVCLAPEGQRQSMMLIDAVVEDGVWSYDSCVTMEFSPLESSSMTRPVVVASIADGKGISCSGSEDEMQALRSLVVSAVQLLSPLVELEQVLTP